MHGGIKIYAGSPGAARNYVEADRGRADDYYLAEGTGVAERYVASPAVVVQDEVGKTVVVERVSPLTGDGYEAWVAGLDPDTGQPRGRLRSDDRAVRFVEVIVNGPKSWSLAAELHPDISVAYDAAQDRAATQIIGWLAEHATTRVGPRGGQVQIPVEVLEAVTVRHYTSRAGDPHRHLHLQINARVFADGAWRGLHTIGVRDFLGAINGIGHAAVVTDSAFRAALAAHGYTLDLDSDGVGGGVGEIEQLAPYVGPFSQRAAQIERSIAGYEADWAATHPGEQPGSALRRIWDARAWADARPDKVVPQPGVDIHGRWLRELAELGYRDRDKPIELSSTPVGAIDRQRATETVLARLAAGRSAWNAADIRGQVELLIAGAGVVTDAVVRGDLAEDLTTRALDQCVPLLDRAGVPEHIRALTSQHVLEVEADIAGRLAVRGDEPGRHLDPERVGRVAAMTGRDLDAGQEAVVAALAGDRSLVVVEGAAGAGKTTTLSAARDVLAGQGRHLMVVSPTLKAAKVAQAELHTRTGSAAWLAYQHGWRWTSDSVWTCLTPGDLDPATGKTYVAPDDRARLRAGDLLVVDEAGMLDQDTAHALLTIADHHQVRVALVGDRHQLSAVGRGGVLDLAARWVDADACLTLDVVHRFIREVTDPDGLTLTVPDTEYAQLTVAMRTGSDPGAVFDALVARDQIQLHPNVADQHASMAETASHLYMGGERVAVVVDTRDQAVALNAAIRDRLVAAGHVDDSHATTTAAGQRIGVGDRVATRRNDRDLDVANRDTWTVTAISRHGQLTVTNDDAGTRVLPGDYVRRHVELAYATTAHGVQGDTVTTAHLAISEHTGAASAYVAMTRGGTNNIAHVVATDTADARAQWIDVFARDRADLGAAHAAELAAGEVANYAQPRPLDQVLGELRRAWEREARSLERLAWQEPRRDALREIIALESTQPVEWAAAENRYRHARVVYTQAAEQVQRSTAMIAADTAQRREHMLTAWDADRIAALTAAQVVTRGSGPLGLRLPAVNRAREELARWSVKWQPYLSGMPTDNDQIVTYAKHGDNRTELRRAFTDHAQQHAAAAHPGHAGLVAIEHAARTDRDRAYRERDDIMRRYTDQLRSYGSLAHTGDPEIALAHAERDIADTGAALATARSDISRLSAEPAIRGLPAGRLDHEHDRWRVDDERARAAQHRRAQLHTPLDPYALPTGARSDDRQRLRTAGYTHQHHAGHDRDSGPSIGR